MHPKPDDEDTFPILSDRSPTKSSTNEDEATDSNKDKQSEVATANLIQLDGYEFSDHISSMQFAKYLPH